MQTLLTLYSFLHTYNINLSTLQNKDGSYTGFIKVHFQLLRPISLPPRQSVSSTQEEDQQGRRMRRRTSFYLPKDTAKHLHISSQTRVREVIEALLKKFTVVDNPAKFALFERTERQSQGRTLYNMQLHWNKTVTLFVSAPFKVKPSWTRGTET